MPNLTLIIAVAFGLLVLAVCGKIVIQEINESSKLVDRLLSSGNLRSRRKVVKS